MKSSFLFQLCWMFILTILLTPSLANARNFHEVKLGKTQFTQKIAKNLVVEVDLHQKLVDGKCSYENTLLWGGEIYQPPKTVMGSLAVKVNSKKVTIPFSAYSDLGDIRGAELEKIAGGFSLILGGGGTSTSYHAVLTFKQGYLYSKKVTAWAFPTQRWEKTIYSFIKDN